MKRLLPLLLGIPASFAAGWFLRPADTSAGGTGGREDSAIPGVRTVRQKPAGCGRQESLVAPRPSSLEVKPLTSLAEVLGITGDPATLKEGEMMVVAMMELLPRLMLTDGATVKGMAEELNAMQGIDQEGKQILMMGLIFRWMTVNPEEAIGFSMANPKAAPDGAQMNRLGIVYLAKARPESARRLVSLMPEEDREEVSEFLTKMEAERNPSAYLTDPKKHENLSSGEIGGLAAKWMRTDPAAAMAWLETLPAEKRADGRIASRIAAVRMQQDPAATLAWAQSLPEGPERARVRERVVESLVSGAMNQAEIEAKLSTLPPDWQAGARLGWMAKNTNENGGISSNQLTEILRHNPALGSDQEASRVAKAAAANFAKTGDYTGGKTWAMQLPAGTAQNSAIATLATQWAAKDAVAASEWISTLPAGNMRDSAASALIRKISPEDPQSALVWARSLSSESSRTERSREVFNVWLTKRPLEAIPAIQALPPEEQTRIFAK